MTKAPEEMNGKKKVYEEEFRSPTLPSHDSAMYALEQIRIHHSSDHGWFEFSSSVEEVEPGQWVAIRHHAKYA